MSTVHELRAAYHDCFRITGGRPSHIYCSPRTYSHLLSALRDYPEFTDTLRPNQLTFAGIPIREDHHLDNDMVYFLNDHGSARGFVDTRTSPSDVQTPVEENLTPEYRLEDDHDFHERVRKIRGSG